MTDWEDSPQPEEPGWKQIHAGLHGQLWRRPEPTMPKVAKARSGGGWAGFAVTVAAMAVAYSAGAWTLAGAMPAWVAGLLVLGAAGACWISEVGMWG